VGARVVIEVVGERVVVALFPDLFRRDDLHQLRFRRLPAIAGRNQLQLALLLGGGLRFGLTLPLLLRPGVLSSPRTLALARVARVAVVDD